MDIGLRDKVAVVTGGSKGIGRAIVLELASEGCKVAFSARGEEALRQTEQEAAQHAEVLGVQADMTQPADIERVIDGAATAFGGIDILINNVVKAGMNSWSKSLAKQLAPDGILVNVVAPGSILFPGGSWERRQQDNPEFIANFVRTEMPLGRFGRPEEVAAMVVFLASRRGSLMTGACINVDGCQSRSNI